MENNILERNHHSKIQRFLDVLLAIFSYNSGKGNDKHIFWDLIWGKREEKFWMWREVCEQLEWDQSTSMGRGRRRGWTT